MFEKYKLYMHKSHKKDYERNRRGYRKFLKKLKGGGECPPRENIIDIVWSACGIFITMPIIYSLTVIFGSPFIVASIGASSVLIFCKPDNPYSQPRSIIGGHIISALVGVSAYQLFYDSPVLAASFAVAFATVIMLLTRTVHPPGGATALFAVIGSEELHRLGFSYAFFPCGLSAVILVFFGLIFINLSARRKYPLYWW